MKKQDVENLENWLKTLKEANVALRKGFGPAHNSNNIFVAIPGITKYNVYLAIVIEKSENGGKPVDWYSWSPNPKFLTGFGGYYNDDYDKLIKENPWVKDVWDSLDEEIKAVFEKKYEEDDKTLFN